MKFAKIYDTDVGQVLVTLGINYEYKDGTEVWPVIIRGEDYKNTSVQIELAYADRDTAVEVFRTAHKAKSVGLIRDMRDALDFAKSSKH